MSEAVPLCIKIDADTNITLETLAAKKRISKSALVRRLIKAGLEKELAAESVDFVRDQIHAEIKASCNPQFNRLAKLIAKVGYQSVACFYLESYIMDAILPPSKRVEFEEMKRNAKAMAVAYLRLDETEFQEFMKSEDAALGLLDLR